MLAGEGDFGQEFFVIDSGTADVSRGGERVAEPGPGDFFGELALLNEERRTATVTATSPMSLIVMTRSSFRTLDRTMPKLHATIAQAHRRSPPARELSGSRGALAEQPGEARRARR